jgi:3-hydroxyacyl-[acyl-carrier-protein] dehydratase
LRWIWIDRFEQFDSGHQAVAVKNVTLAEEHLHDHVPGFPVMPASLMIEGMAQTAGILVGEAKDFAEKVILAKVKRAVFHSLVRPGDTLRYNATLEMLQDAAATTTGTITVGDDCVGEVDIVFSHIDQNMSGLNFPKENFVFTPQFMALLKGYRSTSAARVTL